MCKVKTNLNVNYLVLAQHAYNHQNCVKIPQRLLRNEC